MRKQIICLVILLIAAAAAAQKVAAHPLGNFSINQFSRLEIEKSQVKVRAVLDMAEIPTFQASAEIDTDRDGTLSGGEVKAYAEKITPGYMANLSLTVNGVPVRLDPTVESAGLQAGSGNLPVLRIVWDSIGELPGLAATNRVQFENKNNSERIGWNEIVVHRTGGINVFDSTGYGSGVTDELKAYPQENLSAPLVERAVEFSFSSQPSPENAKPLQNRDGHLAAPIEKDAFAELINREMTVSLLLAGLFLAFGFGAMHALSPGHGKTVVGAYLVGSRGTVKHAVFLGLTVTVTHTISVFALGFIMLFASNFILPERLMPFLSFVSGLLVFFIGISLFKDRLFGALGWNSNVHHHDHSRGGGDAHFHDQDAADSGEHAHGGLTHTHGGSTHTHVPPNDVSWRSLLGLGISGGLLPCPSALVLMLSAINLNRIGYGIVLTLVFSFGLAATLTAVGLIFLYGGKIFGSSRFSGNRIVKTLPVFSAFVIACVGAVICYNSLI
jgi:ABC-type nickel/cobalt efflux system permease component RcnA